jgi:phospholipid/cholesterol/gamma-HCH transport system ATP-binding protein
MTEMIAPIVELQSVDLSFEDKDVLKKLSLSIRPQERFVLMGQSGCGKSTILRLIVGSLKPNRGVVRFEGREINKMRRSALNKIRANIGMVYQQSALISSMTVEENLAFPLEELSRKSRLEIAKIIDETLDFVDMREAKKLNPSELSGGMRKRIGVARALVLKPRLILFDEPSAGLDPVTSSHISELIISLTDRIKTTSIIVTHEMESAFQIATRMALLHEGQIIEEDTPDEFKNSPNQIVQQFIAPMTPSVTKETKYANQKK